jgi:hypothetical protein
VLKILPPLRHRPQSLPLGLIGRLELAPVEEQICQHLVLLVQELERHQKRIGRANRFLVRELGQEHLQLEEVVGQ